MGGGSLIDSIAIYGPKFIAVTILAVVFVIKELFFVNIGRTFTHVWVAKSRSVYSRLIG